MGGGGGVNRELMGVDELTLKSNLVVYPDGGLVEDLPWKDHGLGWVSRLAVACKR